MPQKKNRVLLSTALCLALTFPVAVNPLQVSATSVVTSVNVYPAVKISANASFRLSDLQVIPDDSGKTVAIKIEINNGDIKTLSLEDYWVRLSTIQGERLVARLIDEDKSKKKVVPKGKETLTYYLSISDKTSVNDLRVSIVRFDFSQPNYEKSLGHWNLNSKQIGIVSAASYKKQLIGNAFLNSRIKESTIDTSSTGSQLKLSVLYSNTGTKTVKQTKLQYYIVTKDNIVYPATIVTQDEDILLYPYQKKTVSLSVLLPPEVKTTGLQLVTATKFDKDGVSTLIPTASYSITSKAPTTNLPDVQTIITDQGDFQVKAQGIYRYPSANKDIVLLNIELQNKETKSLTVPSWIGSIKFDNGLVLDAAQVKGTSTALIAANGRTTLQFFATIPSELQYNEAKWSIQSKDGSSTSTLAELVVPSTKTLAIPQDGTNISSFIQNGTEVKLQSNWTRTYLGKDKNIFLVNMDKQWLGNRTSQSGKVAGYFVTKEGIYYPATVVDNAKDISPTEHNEVLVWASLPKSLDTSGLKLILGQGVSAEGSIESDGTPVAYVSPRYINLPNETQFGSVMKGLQFNPYILDVVDVRANVEKTKLKILMDYNLIKDNLIQKFDGSRSVYMTIEDDKGNELFGQEVTLDKAEGRTLNLGSHHIDIEQSYDDFTGQIGSLTQYTFNIYEKFQNSKKHLVQKSINWSIYTNWADQSDN